MLPFVARATIEVLALVPNSLREASLGLGIPQWRTTLSIVVPRAAGGIVTGTVLAAARVAGETAPLLFTSSLVGTKTSWDPLHALQSVPVAIFELSESPDPKDHARAWAAGFILLVFILQNQIAVTIQFLGFKGSVPVGVALLLAAIAGGKVGQRYHRQFDSTGL